ncbi:MAG TPA: hypothetical protein VN957_21150 [Chthoniobacterales bacterium]|jgi:hypothetical protein|nr:hypothetical protein [Chthoniobacterales bacterium]
MATQFNLSGSQVFVLQGGESFELVSLSSRRVYRVQNHGPATIVLEWDSSAGPQTLSIESGRSIDLEVSRLGVRIPSSPPPGPYAVGWYQLLG